MSRRGIVGITYLFLSCLCSSPTVSQTVQTPTENLLATVNQAAILTSPVAIPLSDTEFRIHERLLNKFLATFETFSGKGEKRIGVKTYTYEWHIKNPELSIFPNGAKFEGDIFIKLGKNEYQDRVKGTATLTYLTDQHLIDIHVTSALFPLKINLLGNDITLLSIDIALLYPIHFYIPSLAQYLQDLPLSQANGTERFNIHITDPEMSLTTQNILLTSTIEFEKITPPKTPTNTLTVPSQTIQLITPNASLL